MIKINFIAERMEAERHEAITRASVVFFASIMIFSCMLLLFAFQDARTRTGYFSSELRVLDKKIQKEILPFEQAMVLYAKRQKYRRKINKHAESAIQLEFINDSMDALIKGLPEKMWLDEIHFSATEPVKKGRRKRKRSKKVLQTISVKANSIVDIENGSLEQIREFHKQLKRIMPLATGQSQLELDVTGIKKMGFLNYYSFSLFFSWTDVASAAQQKTG